MGHADMNQSEPTGERARDEQRNKSDELRPLRKRLWFELCKVRHACREQGYRYATDSREWMQALNEWQAAVVASGLTSQDNNHHEGTFNYTLSNGEEYIDGEAL